MRDLLANGHLYVLEIGSIINPGALHSEAHQERMALVTTPNPDIDPLLLSLPGMQPSVLRMVYASRHREKRAMLKKARSVALLLFLSAPLSLCDVVELKTGERLEGAFKQATSAGVVIEVGGQPITMPLAKVRAIYFGAAPSHQAAASPPSAAHVALRALKGLESATTVGVNLRDYTTRLADIKLTVDQFVQSPPEKIIGFGERASRKPLSLALRYYELEGQAWRLFSSSDNGSGDELLYLGTLIQTDAEIGGCPALNKLFAARPGLYGTELGRNPAILWSCASGKITEAERLLGK